MGQGVAAGGPLGAANVEAIGDRAARELDALNRWISSIAIGGGAVLEEAALNLRELDLDRRQVRVALKDAWQIRTAYRQADKESRAEQNREFSRRFESAWVKGRAWQAAEPQWFRKLKTTREGTIRRWPANLRLILLSADKLRGLFQWNEQASRIDLSRAPPWPEGTSAALYPRELRDADLTDLQVYCQDQWDADFAFDTIVRVVASVAQKDSYNPLQDYLSGLEWDGVKACEDWLSIFFHVESTPYTQAVARCWMIQAVKRAFEPGCQADYVLVLEGDQGLGKSRALRALAARDEWFADSHINVEDQRAAATRIQGKWIYELAELPQRKADADKFKGFITNSVDRYRDFYGRTEVDRPRRCVFAASINPPPGGAGYLSDPTGARRFWPVRVPKAVDVEGLREAAPQLWAEAVHRYRQGELSYLKSEEMNVLAAEEQEQRAPSDPWVAQLELWASYREELTTLDVLDELCIPAERRMKNTEIRAASVIAALGYKNDGRKRQGGKRLRVYRRKLPPIFDYVIRMPRRRKAHPSQLKLPMVIDVDEWADNDEWTEYPARPSAPDLQP